MTKAFHLLPLLCLLAFVPTHGAAAQQAATQNAPAAATLDLSSPDGRHVTLTADALQSLPRQTVRVHNPHRNADENYQGVELSLLLARLDAPLGAKLRGKALAMYIVAEGTDKYSAVYSLAEVDPASTVAR
jgi:hypothetical protein